MKLSNLNRHLVGIKTWRDQVDVSTLDDKQKKRIKLIDMSIEFAKDIKGDTEDENKERQGEWDTIRNNGKYFDDFPVIKTGATKHTDQQIAWQTHNNLIVKSCVKYLAPAMLDILRLVIRPSARKGGYWTVESIGIKLAEEVSKEQKRAIKEKRDNAPETLLEGAFHSPSPPPIVPPKEKDEKKTV